MFCVCIDSISEVIGSELETIFKRKRIYYVVVNMYKGDYLFKVYGDEEYGWDLTCPPDFFKKHFVLINNKKDVVYTRHGNEIPRKTSEYRRKKNE